MCSIEIVLYGVVVGWCSNHHEVGFLISCLAIKSSSEVQRLLCQIFLDIVVLDRRNTVIEFLYLFRNYIYCCNMMVLRQQCCYTQTDVASSGYGYFNVFEIVHCYFCLKLFTYLYLKFEVSKLCISMKLQSRRLIISVTRRILFLTINVYYFWNVFSIFLHIFLHFSNFCFNLFNRTIFHND